MTALIILLGLMLNLPLGVSVLDMADDKEHRLMAWVRACPLGPLPVLFFWPLVLWKWVRRDR